MEEIVTALISGTTNAVQLWMGWMFIIFTASLMFVYKHVSARIIVFALLLTIVFAFVIFQQTKNIHLLGIPHIICWLPLTIYLIKSELMHKTGKLKSTYNIYLVLLVSTICISLIFDVRDIILVSKGMK